MASAITLALVLIGGKAALVLAPTIAALITAHSIGAVGGVLAATTIAQRVQAGVLLIKLAPVAHRVNQDIITAIRELASRAPRHGQVHSVQAHHTQAVRGEDGHIIAVVRGGPGGYGRAPVHFIWQPAG